MPEKECKSTATREELELMAKRSGLNLSPEHFDQLCSAWKHIENMLGRIPREYAREAEPAHIFLAQ